MIYLDYTTYYIIKEKHRNNLNLKNKVKKIIQKLCQFKKNSYLCIAIEGET